MNSITRPADTRPQQPRPEPILAKNITLRDYLAAKALPAVYEATVNECRHSGWPNGWRFAVAIDAYRMADEMLKARILESQA